ncbi:MAG TPA: site-specific DNA-methyltransferase, partial [Bacteroidales bacterium]|nr:site-specific DNA-methyltransferase [Bacteroidales bacterium]
LADGEMAWSSFQKAMRIFTYARAKALKEGKIHPTQKPVDLYRWILKNYAKPNDKILDTHGGSMSSAIACHMEGFELDICELDKEYFDAAVNRFKIYEQQQKLF